MRRALTHPMPRFNQIFRISSSRRSGFLERERPVCAPPPELSAEFTPALRPVIAMPSERFQVADRHERSLLGLWPPKSCASPRQRPFPARNQPADYIVRTEPDVRAPYRGGTGSGAHCGPRQAGWFQVRGSVGPSDRVRILKSGEHLSQFRHIRLANAKRRGKNFRYALSRSRAASPTEQKVLTPYAY